MLKWLWVSILVVFADQLTKWIAEAQIEAAKYAEKVIVENGVERIVTVLVEPAQVIPVMPHLNWTLAYNYGAAFSMLGDQSGWQRWFFAILAIVVSLYILYWLRKLKENERWTAIALSLVLGGAVGNLIDRVLYGRVIDFIDFYIDWDVFFLHNGHFATFNVADIAITIGATLLVFMSLFHKEEAEEKKQGIL